MKKQFKFRVLATVIVMLIVSINAEAQLGGAINRARRAIEQTTRETEQSVNNAAQQQTTEAQQQAPTMPQTPATTQETPVNAQPAAAAQIGRAHV